MLGRLLLLTLACALPSGGESRAVEGLKPNLVVILADDLGWGDVACYGGEHSKIATPNLDRLASQGLRFTDAHAAAAICSPSRYALLTGRYAWRTPLRAGNVEAWQRPLIAADRLTLPRLAHQQGYRTACIGKWHLGWDWGIPTASQTLFRRAKDQTAGGTSEFVPSPRELAAWKEAFSKPIPGGPTTRGFDEYFGVDVPNWPPYCFLENDHTVGAPSELLPRELVGKYRVDTSGPAVPNWKLENLLPELAKHACDFVARRKDSSDPFCLYFALTAPHTPFAVTEARRGKSGLSEYGDWVMEMDATVGRVLDALEASGHANDTLVIFASDNGCAKLADFDALKAKGHSPSGPFRGSKFDAWEGGHRVPFIVRWPGVVEPGRVCAQTVGLVDVLATFAAILEAPLPANAAEDSVSFMPLLFSGDVPVRESLVTQSGGGAFVIRMGAWKAIFGPEDGPLAPRVPPHPELYDLAKDPGETVDLAAAEPEQLERMRLELQRQIDVGRSTPGEMQKNDVAVRIYQRAAPGSK